MSRAETALSQSLEQQMPELPAQPPRRTPTQQRSRERVERMLAVATALIAEQGSDAMRMSEVAEKAGVSIGSLYQYFPDKGAIIRTLAERYNAQGRACVQAEFADVRDMEELKTALARVVDGYYAMFLAEPVMRDIWSGTQADKALQDMDAADARVHGAMLAEVLVRLRPEADGGETATAAFLMMQLIAATVRLAITVERDEAEALLATFKRMMLRADLLAS